jgi:hypothetical protein
MQATNDKMQKPRLEVVDALHGFAIAAITLKKNW